MLLYDNAISGNCYKVRLLLHRLGVAYERRELDVVDRSERAATLGALTPALHVPTLVLDDGRALGESGAILFHLAELDEQARWLPTDPFGRAQVLQWMFFEQYSHEPNVAVPRFWAHAHVDPDPREREARRAAGDAALDAMERHLGDRAWFVGDRDSIADVALYAYTHVAHEGGFSLARRPAISAWLQRFAALPGHTAIDA